MNRLLLVLEILWVFGFIFVCIYSFTVTNKLPDGQNIRSDLFGLRTHIAVSALILGLNKFPPNHWLIPFLLFLIFSDAYNLVEICFFSPIHGITELYVLGIIVSAFQTLITLLTALWTVWLIWKKSNKYIYRVQS